MITFESHLDKHNDNAIWGHHIPVPDDVVEYFKKKKAKRLVCILEGEHELQCALMPKGDGTYFININAAIRKKMRLTIGTKLSVQLKKDESKYGLPMPEEMKELLLIDDEANTLFHQLTAGKQRSLLYIIGKPKSSNKRLEKAVLITDYLKSTNGRLDFIELNQFIKDFNQR